MAKEERTRVNAPHYVVVIAKRAGGPLLYEPPLAHVLMCFKVHPRLHLRLSSDHGSMDKNDKTHTYKAISLT